MRQRAKLFHFIKKDFRRVAEPFVGAWVALTSLPAQPWFAFSDP